MQTASSNRVLKRSGSNGGLETDTGLFRQFESQLLPSVGLPDDYLGSHAIRFTESLLDKVVAMFSGMCRFVIVSGLLISFSFSAANAQEAEEKQGFFAKMKERLDLNPRTSFFGQHKWKYKEAPDNWTQLQRAGNPQCYAPWASCEDDRHYTGYYIGGGATFGGDARVCRREGTWGWDYAPWWSKVKLGWFHGRRYQAGEGQYQPDLERVSNPLNDFTNP